MLKIVINSDMDCWRDYCARHPAVLYTHPAGWTKTLAATYDLPSFFLMARTSGPLSSSVGILPMLLFSLPGSPSRLISLPYTDAAGFHAESQDVGYSLVSAALDLADDVGAVHLELRQYQPLKIEKLKYARERWTHAEHTFKVGLSRPLPSSTDELWKDLSAKVRNQVRKAYRSGCVGRIGGKELLEDFHAVFTENMRDLGSPTHDPELFRQVMGLDSPHAGCIVICYRGTPVAGAVLLKHGSTLSNPWAASLRRFREFCPNMLLYWMMLCQGIKLGCDCFDFGRSSPGASTCRFKVQWGARGQPLVWHVFSRSPHIWHPENESLVNEDWKRLDLTTSRCKGPAIRRWISL